MCVIAKLWVQDFTLEVGRKLGHHLHTEKKRPNNVQVGKMANQFATVKAWDIGLYMSLFKVSDILSDVNFTRFVKKVLLCVRLPQQ